jgi:anti-anti-sigma factor
MRFSAERLIADVTILDLASEQALGDMDTHVANRVSDLIGEGRRKFVLNFDHVAYIDSSGLGDLAAAHQAAARENATLTLLNVPARVQTLLRTVNLLRVFEIVGSEAEAIRRFQ